jgi:hypothetical protein
MSLHTSLLRCYYVLVITTLSGELDEFYHPKLSVSVDVPVPP